MIIFLKFPPMLWFNKENDGNLTVWGFSDDILKLLAYSLNAR